MWPNPAADYLYVSQETTSYRETEYLVYSSQGRIAAKGFLARKNLTTIDLSNLQPGDYFFKIISVKDAPVTVFTVTR